MALDYIIKWSCPVQGELERQVSKRRMSNGSPHVAPSGGTFYPFHYTASRDSSTIEIEGWRTE